MEIHHAVACGHLDNVKRLMQATPSCVHHPLERWFNATPLMSAAWHRRSDVARCLLDHEANVNGRDDNGRTALYRACLRDNNHRMVALLLERGADPTLTGWRGRSPLISAAHEGEVEVVVMLLRHGGSEIDGGDDYGQTALYWACHWDHDEVAGALLEAGADPCASNLKHHTAFDVAAEEGSEACRRRIQEWERSYMVCKARRVRDACHAIHHAPHAPLSPTHTPQETFQRRIDTAPAYIKPRLSASVVKGVLASYMKSCDVGMSSDEDDDDDDDVIVVDDDDGRVDGRCAVADRGEVGAVEDCGRNTREREAGDHRMQRSGPNRTKAAQRQHHFSKQYCRKQQQHKRQQQGVGVSEVKSLPTVETRVRVGWVRKRGKVSAALGEAVVRHVMDQLQPELADELFALG